MKLYLAILLLALSVGAQTANPPITTQSDGVRVGHLCPLECNTNQVQGQCNPNATCGLMPGEAVPVKKPVRTGRFKQLCRFDMSDGGYEIDVCPDITQ